ncbi:MAG: hypothetical protein AAFU65_07475 [Pseudomonadota bacterium]
MCFTTAADVDTGRWQARLHVDEQEGAMSPPVIRSGATLCFERTLPEPGKRRARLCADVMSGTSTWQTCTPVEFRTDAPQYDTRLNAALAAPVDEARHTALRELTTALVAARRYGQAMRTQLVDAHFRRQAGATEPLVLDPEPPAGWRTSDVAARHIAQLNYENAMRALARGDLDAAYLKIRASREQFDRTVDAKRIVAATREAHILQLAGAEREAREELAAAIEACRERCAPALTRDARNALAWWLINDPAASATQWREARQLLTDALVGTQGLDRANVLINLGLLDAIEGVSDSNIDQANALLTDPVGPRAERLRQWAAFVRARSQTGDASLAAIDAAEEKAAV